MAKKTKKQIVKPYIVESDFTILRRDTFDASSPAEARARYEEMMREFRRVRRGDYVGHKFVRAYVLRKPRPSRNK
jgi:hypothetical protein